jgi:hypothetical protein
MSDQLTGPFSQPAVGDHPGCPDNTDATIVRVVRCRCVLPMPAVPPRRSSHGVRSDWVLESHLTHCGMACSHTCRSLDLGANKLTSTIPEGISALSRLMCVLLASHCHVVVLDNPWHSVHDVTGTSGSILNLTCAWCAQGLCCPWSLDRSLTLASNSLSGTLSAGISALTRLRSVSEMSIVPSQTVKSSNLTEIIALHLSTCRWVVSFFDCALPTTVVAW